jgi:hypothetical protein
LANSPFLSRANPDRIDIGGGFWKKNLRAVVTCQWGVRAAAAAQRPPALSQAGNEQLRVDGQYGRLAGALSPMARSSRWLLASPFASSIYGPTAGDIIASNWWTGT